MNSGSNGNIETLPMDPAEGAGVASRGRRPSLSLRPLGSTPRQLSLIESRSLAAATSTASEESIPLRILFCSISGRA